MKKFNRIILSIVILTFLAFYKQIFNSLDESNFWISPVVITLKHILILACSSWILIEIVRILKNHLLHKFDINNEDNLNSRKLTTQINLLEKVIVFVIILITIGLMLISIDSIREIGIGIFASAGVVGIILGLSAQKIVGAVLAGIQIAITQPFRIDDAVVVENEWGWIEEINLTYIVVRIWDKKVNVIQVTDSKENYMEIRILVSAKNSPTAWDLRVYIREKMIEFIQKNYPESLPKQESTLRINKAKKH